MKFERVLSADIKDHPDVWSPHSVESLVAWKRVDCVIKDAKTGEINFHQEAVEVPEQWSQHAANILASKYFRKAGLPAEVINNNHFTLMPNWLYPREITNWKGSAQRGEITAKQVFHRMAGAWTYHGWQSGLITDEEQARIFYDECYLALALQYAAPNSPQWFNTGLWWAYGIVGPDSGMWICDDDGEPEQAHGSYVRPQPHACFLTPIEDDLVNEGGIMDTWNKEARIFKHGSGSGINISKLREKNARLSGGGKSSGPMSFLRVGDSAAGAIQSGGVTRRAAKMVIIDDDHPDVEDFIDWKVIEEAKAASMYVGSQMIRDAYLGNGSFQDPMIAYPQQVIERTQHYEPKVFGVGWEHEANKTVDGQNSNNSVRVHDSFMRAVVAKGDWHLTSRLDETSVRAIRATDLWDKICRAAWACADPGLLFHETINSWHTCSNDGPIRTCNPCAEYHFLDDTACNLASSKLTAFLKDDEFDVGLFVHINRLFTVILDISNSMASFPSKGFALGTYNYRTIGLGYCDLGGLLMRIALPYDSGPGRWLAASITSLMTAVSYHTSSEMAAEVGPFPRWETNKESFFAVMEKHTAASAVIPRHECNHKIADEANKYWDKVVLADTFRNAQATVIAPTGTISFVLDADTTGMECEFSLVKYKHLAGGGTMKIVNQCVEPALRRLGIADSGVGRALAKIEKDGTLEGDTLYDEVNAIFECSNPAPGFTRCLRWQAHVEMLAAIQPFLSGAASKTINLPNSATVQDVSDAYMMCWKKGVKAVALYRDGSKLSQPLQTAPIEKEARRTPMDLGIRIGVDVPLTISADPKYISAPETLVHVLPAGDPMAERISALKDDLSKMEIGPLVRGQKEQLPWRRKNGYTQKAKIGDDGQEVFWHVREYPDGRPGEIFIDLSLEGSTMRSFVECIAIQMSVSLQHGTPIMRVADKFLNVKFEPAGFVEGHDYIKFASSIVDLIARDLLITYADRMDLANAKPVRAEATADAPLAPKHGGEQQWHAPYGKRTGEFCPKCHSELRRAGTCMQCVNCEYNEGCG